MSAISLAAQTLWGKEHLDRFPSLIPRLSHMQTKSWVGAWEQGYRFPWHRGSKSKTRCHGKCHTKECNYSVCTDTDHQQEV